MKSLGLLIYLFLPLVASAQTPPKLGAPLAEISLETLDLISFDTKDQLFASNTSGDIYLYSQEGKQLNLFSPARQGRLNQLEASWTVNIFSFSADLQEYRILDRFLNPLAEKGFSPTEINLAKAATLGNNNVIWVWDESDLNLKSLDYLRNLIIQSQPLNLILASEDLNISEIREFKNRLFINVPTTGIFIFDNQGNLMRKVAVIGINKLCYYKDHLLWLEAGKLMAVSLSTNETLTLAQLDNSEASYLQIGQERLAIVSKDTISLYHLPSWLKTIQ
ncbi:hypothetical protein [Algoriphagus aquimarinus]|uniref:WD40 repeat domain-containing protein n=1 Tax=Algoriphagus aquimarinus TaxID=237018 RepID=A0A1I0XDV8_9BACT|nr:hypothetical protein [Algoriphagus aquimarinus]SFA98123.1 hypothetical protein SAMN04489723_10379 [Algoriphagus aquimarinus]